MRSHMKNALSFFGIDHKKIMHMQSRLLCFHSSNSHDPVIKSVRGHRTGSSHSGVEESLTMCRVARPRVEEVRTYII